MKRYYLEGIGEPSNESTRIKLEWLCEQWTTASKNKDYDAIRDLADIARKSMDTTKVVTILRHKEKGLVFGVFNVEADGKVYSQCKFDENGIPYIDEVVN